MYIPKAGDPEKTERAKVPYQALDWLIQKLDQQGMSLEKLKGMNQGAVAEMALMVQQSQPPLQIPGPPQPGMEGGIIQ